ncbi:transmembrane protein 245-like [Iris pallida]|uniref:Transmembrane protein 245-like n=1 Tax=Iris pallida TaxID=29817 RepID=A0AAX6EY75_IRIPA|nr:transmembrane protein 245-like [Iris pallida]
MEKLVPFGYSSPSQNPNPTASLPWSDMFRSASLRRPSDSLPPTRPSSPRHQRNPNPNSSSSNPDETLTLDPHARLALYVAMAHAGLALSLLLLYGLYRLLHSYLRPLQWALLCSIPLRQIQTLLVDFWSKPLSLGLLPTLLALPSAALRSSSQTLSDLRSLLFIRHLRNKTSAVASPAAGSGDGGGGFPRLMRWLASFSLFLFLYERLGVATTAAVLLPAFFLAGPTASVASLAATKSSIRGHRGALLTSALLSRLKTIVAVALMAGMLLGLLSGAAFFSYKIGMEGKDAVISLKSHVESSNYAERIGFKNWIEENNVPELVDQYSAKVYETVWDQLDRLAEQYNLTEFANGLRHFLVTRKPSVAAAGVVDSPPGAPPTTAVVGPSPHPYTVKLQALSARVKRREWAEIYNELDLIVKDLLVTRVDLVEKAKEFAFQGIEVSKSVLASSTTVLGGSASLVLTVVLAIVSGAAEVFNFVSQLMVFLWVLYYLITSESGGATEQVVGLLPISKALRDRCIEVINHAISSVLLATAKIAIFQACLTWLLFRFFSVHFVYMSTVLAFIGPLLPILPLWVSSIPAAAQLFIEGRYFWAVGLTAIHLVLMQYGILVIQEDIPAHSAYLTGLSILGGVTLFPNALEGAIMGPLIMTLVIALKNLYAEFVLGDAEESSG